MIPCQRELFDIPADIAYFNCAYTSPMMRSAQSAGKAAIGAKANPWTVTPQHFFTNLEENRTLFGRVIGCSPDHVAIIPGVSYGIALAAKNVPVAKGQNIVVLEDQFPSNIYIWQRVARENSAHIKTVPRPRDGNWTTAVLEAIDADTAVAALLHCHWTDGTLLDLEKIGRHCRQTGAALVVDGTQSLGAMPFSVAEIQPDFLVATAHKWLLGPYSFGFCYVDPKWHNGVPLEENWLNRAGSEDFSRLVDYQDGYQPGARRYDVGEASNFILAPITAAALRQILQWEVATVAQTLSAVTGKIANAASDMGFRVPGKDHRAPHMIGVTLQDGVPDSLLSVLAEEKIYVSIRGNSIRISPHLYNTDAEVDRLLHAIATLRNL
jgi:selenocysteine lyase/cysteine desulfurase